MTDLNPWAIFWPAFFSSLPMLLALVLSHLRQMRGIKENTDLTKQAAIEVPHVAHEASNKMEAIIHKLDEAKITQEVHDNRKRIDDVETRLGAVEVGVTESLNILRAMQGPALKEKA